MDNIIGTIVNLKDFFKNIEIKVKISSEVKNDSYAFILPAGRNYTIPYFQREIRWTKENVNILVQDIKNTSKFLGNVILSIAEDNNYNVIDGQQRITVLLMILFYLKTNWGKQINELEDYEVCTLKIESFQAYEKFQSGKYDFNSLSDEEKKTDKYHQAIRYKELWDTFQNINELNDQDEARNLYKNIMRCSFNVLLTQEESTNYNIDYFIDVNLKGVKLDTEDIFKGYLFHMNNSKKTLDSWVILKQKSMQYNETGRMILKYENVEELYSLVKIIYHYFNCDLFLNPEFSELSFGNDFYLKRDFKKKNNRNFYKGEHIIKVINDDYYMKECMNNISKILCIFNEIIEGNEPSLNFKKMFFTESDKNRKVDIDTITTIKGLARLLLLDKDITLPYALIVKYFLEIVKEDKKIDDDYAKKFYAIYVYSLFFSHFTSKKEISEIESVLKSSNWYDDLISKIKRFFNQENTNDRRLAFQSKYFEDNNVSSHKCKSLAILFNFFKLTDSQVKVRGSLKELKNYLVNKTEYSVEHFVVNNSKTYTIVKNGIKHKYEKEIQKYSNSVFNFIFIPENLNSTLNNLYVSEKIEILKENRDKIKCEYSNMVLDKASEIFKKLPMKNNELDIEKTEEYFGYNFKRDFKDYSNAILDEIIKKVKS